MKRVITDDLIIWPEDHSDRRMTRPRFKTRFNPEDPKVKPVSSWIEGASRKRLESDENESDERVIRSGLNSEGGRILRKIFGKKVFNYPKPTSLIRSLIAIASDDDEIVLDSFAGSGTTGEAVLRSNEQDGKNRRFILIQQPFDNKVQEKNQLNVCKEVTRVRVEKVIPAFHTEKRKGKSQAYPGRSHMVRSASLSSPNTETSARTFPIGKPSPATSSTPTPVATPTPRNSVPKPATSAPPRPPAARPTTSSTPRQRRKHPRQSPHPP
jgi:hypothetical protein